MSVLRQIWALVVKTWVATLVRHPVATVIRAFVAPIIYVGLLTFLRNLFIPHSSYGVGSASDVLSLVDAMNAAAARPNIAFVNSGNTGGLIDQIINITASPLQAAGKNVLFLNHESDLDVSCRNNLNGVSNCYGAAVFYSSPSEGAGLWNYTIRADSALAIKFNVFSSSNDAQIYGIPLQHAIDSAITSLTNSTLPTVQDKPYSSLSQSQENNNVKVMFQSAVINYLAVAFFLGFFGVIYHVVGFTTAERESGMTPLMEAMMQHAPQLSRIIANHFSFTLLYMPSWIVIAIIIAKAMFPASSVVAVLAFMLLSGSTFVSYAQFCSSFFPRAQLSGIAATIINLAFGIIAQFLGKQGSGTVLVLSILFPPANFVYWMIFVARWQKQYLAPDFSKAAPDNPWTVPGYAFFIITVIQLLVFPALGGLVEKTLYGAGRRKPTLTGDTAIEINGFTKKYKKKVVVDDLNLKVLKGQILVLLGPNGSGKSTTLEAVSGLKRHAGGSIHTSGTIGICPQRNVLWNDLTVEEHVKIFNKLKGGGTDIHALINGCDLQNKTNSLAKTLSGGQKRKLQLALMLAGASPVCCADEVSSGLDPISRRKIWDILLAERGRRTILLTTHFLDEADVLADHIAIIAKGQLRVEGSSAELKSTIGGYKVLKGDETHVVGSAEEALALGGDISSPTIEDVFLATVGDTAKTESFERLEIGKNIGARQIWVLFRKRWTLLRRSFVPLLTAFIVPVVAAALVSLLLKGYHGVECAAGSQGQAGDTASIVATDILVGPTDLLAQASTSTIFNSSNPSMALQVNLHLVNTLDEFNAYIAANFTNITGGVFLEPPTFAWLADYGVFDAILIQNALDAILSNTSISTQYVPFDVPFPPGSGNTLQFLIYFGLVMAAYPGFFAVYPTSERLNHVRSLQKANGVKDVFLWLAYGSFDFIIVLAASTLATIIFSAMFDGWFFLGYFFLIMVLYGLASILVSYIISTYARSTLAAFAFAAGIQA
jgi:ATP-binding cassette subfamily A (ABC1) protein 3